MALTMDMAKMEMRRGGARRNVWREHHGGHRKRGSARERERGKEAATPPRLASTPSQHDSEGMGKKQRQHQEQQQQQQQCQQRRWIGYKGMALGSRQRPSHSFRRKCCSAAEIKFRPYVAADCAGSALTGRDSLQRNSEHGYNSPPGSGNSQCLYRTSPGICPLLFGTGSGCL